MFLLLLLLLLLLLIKTIYTVINDSLLLNINIYKLVTGFNLK